VRRRIKANTSAKPVAPIGRPITKKRCSTDHFGHENFANNPVTRTNGMRVTSSMPKNSAHQRMADAHPQPTPPSVGTPQWPYMNA
jgi:hypothetical protein